MGKRQFSIVFNPLKIVLVICVRNYLVLQRKKPGTKVLALFALNKHTLQIIQLIYIHCIFRYVIDRLRDKYDELARIFKGFADTVRFNETLFNGLLNYSKSCTLLADIKDVEVQRLQAKVCFGGA